MGTFLLRAFFVFGASQNMRGDLESNWLAHFSEQGDGRIDLRALSTGRGSEARPDGFVARV
jgi:hypothetical protein